MGEFDGTSLLRWIRFFIRRFFLDFGCSILDPAFTSSILELHILETSIPLPSFLVLYRYRESDLTTYPYLQGSLIVIILLAIYKGVIDGEGKISKVDGGTSLSLLVSFVNSLH